MFHRIKNLYLRKKNGVGCCDVINLDYYLAKKILPALKQYRKDLLDYELGGYPPEFYDFYDWVRTLDKMIWAFEYVVNDHEFDERTEAEKIKQAKLGFLLFGRYFMDLWL